MKALCWILTLVGAVAGASIVAEVWLVSVSAPQQAAGAGLGLAFVIIPYCAARAIQELNR